MPLIPLALPPGVYRNGTQLQASGRWREASLVRWVDGTMQPVGGWDERITVVSGAPRAALAWSDLSNDARFAVGTADKLIAVTAGGTIVDITPAGLTGGLVDAAVNTGYGGGFYGLGAYGTARPDTGNYSEATTWALDNWGENLLACSVADGKIYEWDLDPMGVAVALSGAPVNNLSLMVTEERFVFALGSGGNSRLVQWSDREDNTAWTPSATNQAGDLELQTSGQIMCGVRTRGQALILTDLDAHTATYQGPPFVYGFQQVGRACGIVSRKAAVSVDQGVFWLGPRGVYRFAGGAVEEIKCDVADFVFADINAAQQSKVYGVSNGQFGEIWWFYPSSGSTENDSYIAFSYREGHWMTGRLSRTAAVDRGIFRWPIWFDADGEAYNHEFGLSHDGNDVFAESGPISIGNGDNVFTALQLYPDEATQGDVVARFKTRFYPNAPETVHGPYAMAAPTSVRFTGRQMTMRLDAARNAAWRLGAMRLDVRERGRR